jgi:hypothetical protein
LTQRLERGFFKKLKGNFARMPYVPGLTKASRALERVCMAFQASCIRQTIWNSWRPAGIIPQIAPGRCFCSVIERESAMENPALIQDLSRKQQGQRGERVGPANFCILNEAQYVLYQAGQCPFCQAGLPAELLPDDAQNANQGFCIRSKISESNDNLDHIVIFTKDWYSVICLLCFDPTFRWFFPLEIAHSRSPFFPLRRKCERNQID